MHKQIISELYKTSFIVIIITLIWDAIVFIDYLAREGVRVHNYRKWRKENNIKIQELDGKIIAFTFPSPAWCWKGSWGVNYSQWNKQTISTDFVGIIAAAI